MMRNPVYALVTALCLTAGIPSAAQAPPDPATLAAPRSSTINITRPQRTAATRDASAGVAVEACPYCDMSNLNLAGVDLSGANLVGANLSHTNLTGAKLNGVMLSGANLSGAILDKATFDTTAAGDADLSRANLTGASLKDAQMNGTDLQYADLSGADLTNVDLTRAKVGPRLRIGPGAGRDTILRGTRIPGHVDLGGATPAGAIRVPDGTRDAAAAGAAQLVCGKADLSVLQTFVYVAGNGTDSPTCGTSPATACLTIQQGIRNCTGPACGVLVAWGEYAVNAPVQLAQGVNVYGGCLPPQSSSPAYFSVILAPPNGQPGVTASGLTQPTILQNFQISGSGAGGTGAASVAMTVANSAGLSMRDLEVLANAGSGGNSGGGSSPGQKGNDASGATAGSNSACTSGNGGNGSVQGTVSVVVYFSWFECNPTCSANGCQGYPGGPGDTGVWASGGRWGVGNCWTCPASRGETGRNGVSGQNAACGGKGTVSGNIAGSFNGLTWSPSGGGSGTRGGGGGGGGGGGAGGYKAGACFWVKTEYAGSQGGGGGAGGCAATAGTGGQQGGGSFAIVAQNTPLNFSNCRLVGGRGGNGGGGGAGGTGGAGGNGATGLSNEGGGSGGNGGSGGAGGGAGGAAGGNSGPSVVIAMLGSVGINGSPVYYTGATGPHGASGAGGPSGNGSCTAPPGDNGLAGAVATTHQY